MFCGIFCTRVGIGIRWEIQMGSFDVKIFKIEVTCDVGILSS